MRIFVTGATGTVGRQVVEHLLTADADVRALTRRPENAGLPAAVEVVGGDLENPESLVPAFDGVDRMYLLATGDTPQIVDLAKQAGVRRIVVLSSASAGFESDPGGEFRRAVERAVEDSGPEWTHVRPGMFAGNLLDWADAIRTEGVVKAPYDAARQSPVHELDIAAVAATALLSDGHHGKIYTLSGPEALTKTEQVTAISKAIGRDIRFEELAPEQWREHVKEEMPPFAIDWLLGSWWSRPLMLSGPMYGRGCSRRTPWDGRSGSRLASSGCGTAARRSSPTGGSSCWPSRSTGRVHSHRPAPSSGSPDGHRGHSRGGPSTMRPTSVRPQLSRSAR